MMKIWICALIVSTLAAAVAADQPPPDWTLRIARGNMLFSETMPADSSFWPVMGNGYIGNTLDSPGIYMQGVYSQFERAKGLLESATRALIPNPATSFLALNSSTQFTLVGAALDVERAVFLRRFRAKTEESILVEQRTYFHREISSIFVNDFIISNPTSQPIVVEIAQPALAQTTDFKISSLATCPSSASQLSNCSAYTGILLKPEAARAPHVIIASISTLPPGTISRVTVPPSTTTKTTFSLLAAFRSSLNPPTRSTPHDDDDDDVLVAAVADFETAALKLGTAEMRFDSHVRAWQRDVWSSGVEISGDLSLATHINATLYALNAAVRADQPYGASPGGLTSGYHGLVYWDNDMWVLPHFINVDHQIARANLQYRFNGIEPAREHARTFGFNGTFFPWNTALTGVSMDLNPVFDPFMVHSVGDIAVAVRSMFYATRDLNWLRTVGYPIVEGIAQFWKSRVFCANDTSSCSIRHVCPPDEYAIGMPISLGVTDSVFTNYVAKISFDFATEAAQLLNLAPDPSWAQISSKLVILFNDILKIHTEYLNFPEGNAAFKFIVKQADVIMLQYPLDIDMPDEVKVNDIKFYDQFYDPTGPAMTRSISTIVWLDFNAQNAQNELLAAQKNIQPPFAVWTETADPFNHPNDMGIFNFITGAGGFMQSMVNGYGGVRYRSDGMYINPRVPLSAKFIKFRGVMYVGNRINIYVHAGDANATVTVVAQENSASLLQIRDKNGTVQRLTLQQPVQVPVGQSVIQVISGSKKYVF